MVSHYEAISSYNKSKVVRDRTFLQEDFSGMENTDINYVFPNLLISVLWKQKRFEFTLLWNMVFMVLELNLMAIDSMIPTPLKDKL